MAPLVPEGADGANARSHQSASLPPEITPEEATAQAIDRILATTFLWSKKRSAVGHTEVLIARIAGDEGAPLRAFQRHGISSAEIARALRAGILKVAATPKTIIDVAEAGQVCPDYRLRLVNAARAHLYARISGPKVKAAIDRIEAGASNPAVDYWNEIVRLNSDGAREDARALYLMTEDGPVRAILTSISYGPVVRDVIEAEARARAACGWEDAPSTEDPDRPGRDPGTAE